MRKVSEDANPIGKIATTSVATGAVFGAVPAVIGVIAYAILKFTNHSAYTKHLVIGAVIVTLMCWSVGLVAGSFFGFVGALGNPLGRM